VNQADTQSLPATTSARPTTEGQAASAGPLGRELVVYASADPEQRRRIDALMAEVDLSDTTTVLYFGSKAQERLTAISDRMLEGVRSKDTGAAGEALNAMIGAIRGFDMDELDPNRRPSFFARLFGSDKPVVKFLRGYEEVKDQIEHIAGEMERHKTRLLTDIASLDRLYQGTLEYFHDLEYYIVAGEERLRRLDMEEIPALEHRAASSEELLDAQALRDLRGARDGLERRIHDLRLTRQVAMQSLPSIRLVQENDKGLVGKIASTLVNTVPLWRQQLAQAVTIYRSSRAAQTLKEATDLTNELLQANADNLKAANAQVRQQLERGVFDIQVIEKANRTLIETIEEGLAIADQGKRARADAEAKLLTLETELRGALSAAKAKERLPDAPRAKGHVG
jgi:uncharacterized protein YaaN involved in tellurite resistance